MGEQDQERYEYKVQYGTGIQSRLSKVHNAIENGKPCTNEFDNLLAYLTDDILKPIKPKLVELSRKYQLRINEVRSMTSYPESTFAWSNRHKLRYRSYLIAKLQKDAINEMLPYIMNRLDEMGYLGYKQKKTQIC